MGTTLRPQRVSIRDELFLHPKQFSFDMAVHILDCKTTVSFGKETSITKAALKTISVIAFHLRATEVENIILEEGTTPAIYANRLAIAGLNAPLPTPYADLAIHRYHEGDYAISSFFNIFNSRLLGISYRLSQRRYLALQKKDQWPMLKCMASFLGEQNVPKQMTHLAYLFWTRGRTIEGLRIMLKSYFRFNVKIYAISEHWEPLQEVIPLGINVLGKDAYLGQKVSMNRFCINVRLTHDEPNVIYDLLSNKQLFAQMSDLIRKYIGPLMICKLEISPSSAPPLKFSASLGRNSWLQGKNVDFLRTQISD